MSQSSFRLPRRVGRRAGRRRMLLLALGLAGLPPAALPSDAFADTVSFSGGWSSPTGTRTPSIPFPAGTVNTNFSGSYNPSFAWHYALYSFTVTQTGSYSATVATGPVTNTTFFLQGLFSPSPTAPATPIGNFLYSQLSPSGSAPYSETFPSLAFSAGTTYSLLIAFNIGGSQAGDYFNFSMTGPGCAAFAGVNSCITTILNGTTALAGSLGGAISPVFQGGTLQMDRAGSTLAQNFTLDSSATNRIDQNGGTSTFSGVFSDASSGGTIAIVNSGSGGRVVFTGASTYTGSTTIGSGATLAVNGAIISPVLVQDGGMLRGTGSIGNQVLVANGGTIAPGNSPGTLTIAGPVVLQAGSTALFDIDGTGTGSGAGNYSRLVLTGPGGAITLGGQLMPQLRGITGSASNSYTPPLGTMFNIISAAGGVSGSFAGLTQPAGLAEGTRFDALYAPNAVNLVVTPSFYGSTAMAGWAAPVGAALDRVRPAAGLAMTPAQAAVFAPLYGASAAQIPVVLGQMSPLVYADALAVQRDAFHVTSTMVGRELQARRGAAAAGSALQSATLRGITMWMAGNGDFARRGSGRDGTPGYHGSAGGLVIGADMAPFAAGRIGLAAAFGSQSMSTSGYGRYAGQSAQLVLYGSLGLGRAFLDGQLGGVFQEGDARRPFNGSTARGHVGGSGIGASLRGGQRFDLQGWGLEPSLTLRTLSLSNRASTEGGSAAGLRVEGRSLASTQSELGLQLDRRFPLNDRHAITALAMVGWNYEMQDTRARLAASFSGLPEAGFVLRGPAASRSTAVAGLRARLDTGTPLSAFAGYDTRLGDRYTAHNVTAGLRYSW